MQKQKRQLRAFVMKLPQIFFGVVPVCFLKNWTKAEGLEKLSLSEISWTVRSVVLRSIFASISTAS